MYSSKNIVCIVWLEIVFKFAPFSLSNPGAVKKGVKLWLCTFSKHQYINDSQWSRSLHESAYQFHVQAITEYQRFKDSIWKDLDKYKRLEKGLGTAFECTGAVKKGVKYDCALLASINIQGVPSIGTHFRFQFLTFLMVLWKKANSAILTRLV